MEVRSILKHFVVVVVVEFCFFLEKVNHFRYWVAPSPTPRCSSYWKGSHLVTLDYSRQLYFLLIFNPPPPRVGCDKRSVLNWSTTGLNAEFSFTGICCHIKVKELVCPTIHSCQKNCKVRRLSSTFGFVGALTYLKSWHLEINLAHLLELKSQIFR